MGKKDMLSKQECIWLLAIIDKEIAYTTGEFTTSNGHPLWKLRLDNLEGLKAKLTNQMNHQPKKRSKAGDGK